MVGIYNVIRRRDTFIIRIDHVEDTWQGEYTTTTIDNIGSDHRLQSNWASRVIAALIDGLITWVVSLIFYVPLWFFAHFVLFGWLTSLIWPFVWGLVFWIYCAILESSSGATIGKRFMNLQVISVSGGLDFHKTLIRNVSKIHFVILVLDVLLGLFTEGDPRQRYLDKVAGTTVITREDIPQPIPYTPIPAPPPQYKPAEGASAPAPEPEKPRQECECGGRLIDVADGKRQCIRCGKVY